MTSQTLTPAAQEQMLQRFLRYTATDSQAVPGSDTYPSSGKQREFARELADELRQMGISDARTSDFGYVYAHLPSNCTSTCKMALLAHLDVAPCCRGEGVRAMVHRDFDGNCLRYPNGDTLSSSECSALLACRGHTLVTSDGTTLLGADDKAGIAILMTLAEHLLAHPEIPRPHLTFCFTPDEEIGAGVAHIDLESLAADFAFTVDGGLPPEVNFETFTAWGATARFRGQSHHPGSAKGNMVNASRWAAEFVAGIPATLCPEGTSGREPFIHVDSLNGTVESAQIHMILRGFSDIDIESQKALLATNIARIKAIEPRLHIELEYKEQYRNMGEILERQAKAKEVTLAACRRLGFEPSIVPIRGGTDGSRLSFMGVPCPNLFTGSTNHHSTREWASLNQMCEAVELLLAICAESVK